jgi:ATP-dependent helicase YprA (DUF1998 family)
VLAVIHEPTASESGVARQLTLDAAIPGSDMFQPRPGGLVAGGLVPRELVPRELVPRELVPRELVPRELVMRRDLVPGVGLHPAVAVWFEQRFDAGPTPPQLEGWPLIEAGRHTLIAAPTGSGKTLAGFLMAINGLYLAHAAGESVAGTRVLYVSPLKALAVDIAENLERPLAEIAAVAEQMGLSGPALTIGVRTGDTPAGERQAMLRRPRTFVITTRSRSTCWSLRPRAARSCVRSRP